MMAGHSEVLEINSKRASLRNNYPKINNLSFPTSEFARHTSTPPPLTQRIKSENNYVINELDSDNSKRKRRESHELSGSAKEEQRPPILLNVPKVVNLSPTSLKLANIEMKKCKVETERERLFRVSFRKRITANGIIYIN